MNFSRRFQGKTSTMTKAGPDALVASSKIPICKVSSSPEMDLSNNFQYSKRPNQFSGATFMPSSDKNQNFPPISSQRTYIDYSKNALQNINQKYNDYKNSIISSNKPVLVQNPALISHRETPLIPIWTNIRSNQAKNSNIQPLRPRNKLSFSQNEAQMIKNLHSNRLSFSHMPSSQGKRENRSKSAFRNVEYNEFIPLKSNSNSPYKREGVKSAQEILMSRRLASLGSPQKSATFASFSYTNSPEKLKLFTDGDQMDRIRFSRAHSHRVPIRSSHSGTFRQRNPSLFPRKESNEEAISRLIETNVVKYMDYLKEKPQESPLPQPVKRIANEKDLDKELSYILDGVGDEFQSKKKTKQVVFPAKIESRLVSRQNTPNKQENHFTVVRPASKEASNFEKVFSPYRAYIDQNKDFIVDDEEAGPRVYFNLLDSKNTHEYI